ESDYAIRFQQADPLCSTVLPFAFSSTASRTSGSCSLSLHDALPILVSGILEDEGFGTRTAADSDSALAALSERRPSLVILDIWLDRKSTRLNSSHVKISYAVFCLKKKKSSS